MYNRTTKVTGVPVHGSSASRRRCGLSSNQPAVGKEWESRLDVPSFDFAAFSGAVERATQQGIVLTTLAEELQRDPDALRPVWEMHRDCERDVPSIDPITDPSYEQFLKQAIESPGSIPEAYFLAKDGDCYIGYSRDVGDIWKRDTPRTLG